METGGRPFFFFGKSEKSLPTEVSVKKPKEMIVEIKKMKEIVDEY